MCAEGTPAAGPYALCRALDAERSLRAVRAALRGLRLCLLVPDVRVEPREGVARGRQEVGIQVPSCQVELNHRTVHRLLLAAGSLAPIKVLDLKVSSVVVKLVKAARRRAQLIDNVAGRVLDNMWLAIHER